MSKTGGNLKADFKEEIVVAKPKNEWELNSAHVDILRYAVSLGNTPVAARYTETLSGAGKG